MDLTPENKVHIDLKSYKELLYGNRFAPVGSPWFCGETGDYWLSRMAKMREIVGQDAHVAASKSIGWDR